MALSLFSCQQLETNCSELPARKQKAPNGRQAPSAHPPISQITTSHFSCKLTPSTACVILMAIQ